MEINKCVHCGRELGNGDLYDLYASHRSTCNSKVAHDSYDDGRD